MDCQGAQEEEGSQGSPRVPRGHKAFKTPLNKSWKWILKPLKSLQKAVAIELCSEPLFVRTLTDLSSLMLKITTSVTASGKTELEEDLFHSLYGVHLLRKEPFALNLDLSRRVFNAQKDPKFKDKMLLYARLLKAERKGLITIEYDLPEALLRRVTNMAFKVSNINCLLWRRAKSGTCPIQTTNRHIVNDWFCRCVASQD